MTLLEAVRATAVGAAHGIVVALRRIAPDRDAEPEAVRRLRAAQDHAAQSAGELRRETDAFGKLLAAMMPRSRRPCGRDSDKGGGKKKESR